MLYKGPAKKVGIFLNEDTRYHLEPLWNAIFTFLRHKHVARPCPGQNGFWQPPPGSLTGERSLGRAPAGRH